MLLLELEKEYIQPLTRDEKWQLIEDIQQMLKAEENVQKYFTPGQKAMVYTPTITPGEADYRAAYQLQQLLEEKGNDV